MGPSSPEPSAPSWHRVPRSSQSRAHRSSPTAAPFRLLVVLLFRGGSGQLTRHLHGATTLTEQGLHCQVGSRKGGTTKRNANPTRIPTQPTPSASGGQVRACMGNFGPLRCDPSLPGARQESSRAAPSLKATAPSDNTSQKCVCNCTALSHFTRIVECVALASISHLSRKLPFTELRHKS